MSTVWLLRRSRNLPQPSIPILVISKLVLSVMPIAEIAIGAVYLHDCPQQSYIPIYLIVLGVFSLVLVLCSCLPCANDPGDGTPDTLGQLCTAWNSLITLFLFCWFIAGHVWVYSIYQPIDTISVEPSCNRTLYLFSFWTIIVVYILLGVFLVGSCFYLIYVYKSVRANATNERHLEMNQ